MDGVLPALVTGLQRLDHNVHAPLAVALTMQVQAPEPYQVVVSVRLHPERLPLLAPPVLLAVRPGPGGGHTVEWGAFDPLLAGSGPTPTGLGAVTGGVLVTGVIPGWHVAADGRPAWAAVTALTFTGDTLDAVAPGLPGSDLVAVVELDVAAESRRFAARRVLAIPERHLERVEAGAVAPACYLPALAERSATLCWAALGTIDARVPPPVRALLATAANGRRRSTWFLERARRSGRPPPREPDLREATFDPGPG